MSHRTNHHLKLATTTEWNDSQTDQLGPPPDDSTHPVKEKESSSLVHPSQDQQQDGFKAMSPSSSAVRWWLAVVVGVMVSVPIGWLLSYAGTLPFFLGPFFFVLFGLLIGAAMHRVGQSGRPYRPSLLITGTAMVVVACWVTSIMMESRDFPIDMAIQAGSQTRYIGGRSISAYRRMVSDNIRRFLREHYPPGGTLGYIRWVFSSGELTSKQIEGIPRTLHPRQSGYAWLIRVVLSVGLLGFGIGSQTLLLRLPDDPTVGRKESAKT